MNFQIFTREMRSYRYYKDRIPELKEKIDDIYYKYSGVKAIRYDKIPSTPLPNIELILWEQMSRELEEPERQLKKAKDRVRECEENLAKLPKDVQEMCIRLFIEEKTYDIVCFEYGYSKHGLWEKVKREVEKI